MEKKKFIFVLIAFVTLFIGVIHVDAAISVSSECKEGKKTCRLVAEYSDDYFGKKAVNHSNDLAKLSIVASNAAYGDAKAFLESCGFRDIIVETLEPLEPLGKEKVHIINVAVGHKVIVSGNKKSDLYAILVRGTSNVVEWISNLDVTALNQSGADQFVIPKNSVEVLFDSYKKKHYTLGATIKIWITGHSRGGAVANLLAHDLSNIYSTSNVYAYTFASPKVIKNDLNDVNIFNYIIPGDIVPTVPLGYGRYGSDVGLLTDGPMDKLYKQMTSQKYEGKTVQAHSLVTYMCAFINTVNSGKKEAKILLDRTSATLYTEQKVSLKTLTLYAFSKVKWKSSNKKVATVDSSGKVTAKKAGTAIITAYVEDKNKSKKKAVCSIKVKKSKIVLNKTKATIYTSGKKTVQLSASILGKASKISWYSDNKAIATVDARGKVRAKKVGTVTIIAKAGKLTGKCKVSVKRPSIKLNKKSVTIYTSGTTTVQLKATVAGPSKKIGWSSSDSSVASVDSTGKVTAQKAGMVTITAKANGVTKKCKVTVKNANIAENSGDMQAKSVYKQYLSKIGNDYRFEVIDLPEVKRSYLLLTYKPLGFSGSMSIIGYGTAKDSVKYEEIEEVFGIKKLFYIMRATDYIAFNKEKGVIVTREDKTLNSTWSQRYMIFDYDGNELARYTINPVDGYGKYWANGLVNESGQIISRNQYYTETAAYMNGARTYCSYSTRIENTDSNRDKYLK